jgi:hypothetical protein
MSLLRRIFSKKLGWVALITLVLLATAAPAITHADGLFDIGNIAYGAISSVAFGLSWIIQSILGFFIIIVTYAIEQILQISFSIIQSPIVALGFPIALSVANLIFVAGLIIIAVATILRIESYGLKNILWKVIAMAVLVNFGLVITGTILSFSDNVTLYFVQAVSPAGDGSLVDFATNITSAFNPQRLVISGVENATPEEVKQFQEEFNSGATSGTMLRPIIGILLSTMTSIMVLIILASLFLVLAYRYIVISLLLVGLPLMWAAWPFPSLSKHFSGWWHKFLNQAFAPLPIVFFLWLGMIVAEQMNNKELLIHPITAAGKGAGPAIFKFLGGLITPAVDSLLQAAMLGAIMGAGLLVSGKMGATFATSGTNAIKAMNSRVKKGLTSRASRVAKRSGAYVKANTQTLQKTALAVRRNTTGAAGQAANNFSLRLQNLTVGKLKDQTKHRVHVDASGEIYDRNGNKIVGGVAKWDNKKHDWERDAAGDIVNQATGVGVGGGKAKIDSILFSHGGHPVKTITGAEAAKWGLTDGNKPTAHIANLTLDSAGDVKDVRAVTAIAAERIEEAEKKVTVQTGQYLTASEKQARQEIAALDAEAEHDGGILSDVAGIFSDASKALGKPGTGGGDAHAPAAKHDDHGKKPH